MSRFENVVEYDQNLNGTGLRVGVVMARFNLPVCEGLLSACIHELKRLGVADADMRIATVPGALEIPLVLQTMARFDNIYEYDNNLNGAGLKVGIVMSRFNLPVCEGLLSSCVNELKRLGVADADMAIANVPGALEIPLVL